MKTARDPLCAETVHVAGDCFAISEEVGWTTLTATTRSRIVWDLGGDADDRSSPRGWSAAAARRRPEIGEKEVSRSRSFSGPASALAGYDGPGQTREPTGVSALSERLDSRAVVQRHNR